MLVSEHRVPVHPEDGFITLSFSYLAEPAVDALGHVDVVPGRPPRAVSPLLGLDGDGLFEGSVRQSINSKFDQLISFSSPEEEGLNFNFPTNTV